MGTKNDPGRFDCYDKAEPDEPIFVLLARDLSAPSLVRAWAVTRRHGWPTYSEDEQVAEAYACANAMEKWRSENR